MMPDIIGLTALTPYPPFTDMSVKSRVPFTPSLRLPDIIGLTGLKYWPWTGLRSVCLLCSTRFTLECIIIINTFRVGL